MNRFTRLKVLVAAIAITAVAAAGVTAGMSYASSAGTVGMGGDNAAGHFLVTIGGGHRNDDFTNVMYTPDTLNITAGDSVTFQTQDRLEPHTVTFGPTKEIARLAKNFITPVPSSAGPPTLVLSSQVVQATPGHTYAGGFANSGILSADYHGITRTAWTVTFTKPGVYKYWCIVHFPAMFGEIIVHPAPMAMGKVHQVAAGYPSAFSHSRLVADTFFPEVTTVHVGDTVVWSAFFHTVTFAPAAKIAKLRTQFVLKTKTSTGQWQYSLNPIAAFPSSRNGCGTKTPCAYHGGFLTSGLLQGNGNKPSIFKVKFTKAGTYHYGCLVHYGMDGTIRVLP